MLLKNIKYITIITVATLLVAKVSLVSAQQPASTEPPSGFEKQHWSQIKQLEKLQIQCLAEVPNSDSVWVGGKSGIYLYDGLKYQQVLQHEPSAKNVREIYATTAGDLYIITSEGLFLRRSDETFTHLIAYEAEGFFDLRRSMRDRNTIQQDASGNIWAKVGNNLYRMKAPNNEPVLMRSNVRTFQLSSDALWVLSTQSTNITKYSKIDLEPNSLREGSIIEPPKTSNRMSFHMKSMFHVTPSGTLYWGMVDDNAKLFKYHPTDQNWELLLSDPVQSLGNSFQFDEAANGNLIFALGNNIYVQNDPDGFRKLGSNIQINGFRESFKTTNGDVLWLWSWHDKIYRCETKSHKTELIKDQLFQCIDHRKNRYFIDIDGNCIRIDETGQKTNLNDSISDSTFHAMFAYPSDSEGVVVVGGSEYQMQLLHWEENQINSIQQVELPVGNRLASSYCIDEKTGDLYVALMKLPILWFRDETKTIAHYSHQTHTIDWITLNAPNQQNPRSSTIKGIQTDPEGRLHILTDNIYQISNDGVATAIELDEWLDGENINRFDFDEQGNLWVAGQGIGVSRRTQDGWKHFSNDSDELSTYSIFDLYCQRSDNVWCLTSEGLIRFDGQRWNTFPIPYHFLSTTPHNPYSITFLDHEQLYINKGDSLMASMFFTPGEHRRGMKNNLELQGFMNPEKLEKIAKAKGFPEQIESLRITFDKNPPNTHISISDTVIPHNGIAMISWTADDRWGDTQRKNLQFSYRINNNNWTRFSKLNRIDLRNLRPGNYRVEVRARDQDFNLEPIPAVVYFRVKPPYWLSLPFLLAVFVVLAIIAFMIALMIRQRNQYQRQLDQHRIDFFTQVSHELRTPLSILVMPLRRIYRTLPDEQKKDLRTSLRGAEHLERLIDQVLDFRKIETHDSSDNHPFELASFATECAFLYRDLAKERSIDFDLKLPDTSYFLAGNIEKIRVVVDNLLSNAFKYTPNGGRVELHFLLSPIDHKHKNLPSRFKLEIRVTDNGHGMEDNELENIFKLFKRGSSTPTEDANTKSSGVGLAIVKRWVDLMKGQISVTSEKNQGSQFTITIPVDAATEAAHEFSPQEVNESKPETAAPVQINNNGRLKVLLVDDNKILRDLFAKELEEKFELVQANNGQNALEILEKTTVDVVVTDVMMEPVNGYELCETIKSRLEICHIPVILLTALKTEEYVIQAWQHGADAYFKKPFDMQSLIHRIYNLAESRNRLQANYLTQGPILPQAITNNNIDEQFVNRAVGIMEDNLNNYDFDVEQFAKQMAMSRASLYKKVKSITGQSPSHFLRKHRMNRAAEFISQEGLLPTEVADRVGFLDLSYFGSCFKKEFGCPPSQYRKQVLSEMETRIHSNPVPEEIGKAS